MKRTVQYFNGRVQKDIESWPTDILADYARLIELLMEFGLIMPHSRALGDGLFELRAHGKEGIGRAMYCYVIENKIVILHAFIKKTSKTPDQDLAIARKRMKEIKNG